MLFWGFSISDKTGKMKPQRVPVWSDKEEPKNEKRLINKMNVIVEAPSWMFAVTTDLCPSVMYSQIYCIDYNKSLDTLV